MELAPISAPQLVARFEKHPSEVKDYSLDLADFLAVKWQPDRAYVATNFVRPMIANGFEYEATTGGRSGRREPTWPIVAAQTVADGSAVWTARVPGIAGQDTITGVPGWAAETGLTVDSSSNTTSTVTGILSGGTDGESYFVTITIATVGGLTLVFVIQIDVTVKCKVG